MNTHLVWKVKTLRKAIAVADKMPSDNSDAQECVRLAKKILRMMCVYGVKFVDPSAAIEAYKRRVHDESKAAMYASSEAYKKFHSDTKAVKKLEWADTPNPKAQAKIAAWDDEILRVALEAKAACERADALAKEFSEDNYEKMSIVVASAVAALAMYFGAGDSGGIGYMRFVHYLEYVEKEIKKGAAWTRK